MHIDAGAEGDRVVILDDLLATGGTVEACCRMAERSGATVVGCAFVIELGFLPGRERLNGYDVLSLVQYASEDE